MNDRRVPNGTRLNHLYPRKWPPAHAGLTYRYFIRCHHCKIPAFAGMTKYTVIPAQAAVRRIGMTKYTVIPAQAGISKRATIARFPLARERPA
jgi:hypothetical protein